MDQIGASMSAPGAAFGAATAFGQTALETGQNSLSTLTNLSSPPPQASSTNTPLGDWHYEHPLPLWVTRTLPTANPNRMADLRRAALIEATGFTTSTPCQACQNKGYDCIILIPDNLKKGSKCSRCTNSHAVCSLVCSPFPD
jgi:hypothetical protein